MRIDDEDYDISDEFLRELTEKYSDINHPLFMDELPSIFQFPKSTNKI